MGTGATMNTCVLSYLFIVVIVGGDISAEELTPRSPETSESVSGTFSDGQLVPKESTLLMPESKLDPIVQNSSTSPLIEENIDSAIEKSFDKSSKKSIPVVEESSSMLPAESAQISSDAAKSDASKIDSSAQENSDPSTQITLDSGDSKLADPSSERTVSMPPTIFSADSNSSVRSSSEVPLTGTSTSSSPPLLTSERNPDTSSSFSTTSEEATTSSPTTSTLTSVEKTEVHAELDQPNAESSTRSSSTTSTVSFDAPLGPTSEAEPTPKTSDGKQNSTTESISSSQASPSDFTDRKTVSFVSLPVRSLATPESQPPARPLSDPWYPGSPEDLFYRRYHSFPSPAPVWGVPFETERIPQRNPGFEELLTRNVHPFSDSPGVSSSPGSSPSNSYFPPPSTRPDFDDSVPQYAQAQPYAPSYSSQSAYSPSTFPIPDSPSTRITGEPLLQRTHSLDYDPRYSTPPRHLPSTIPSAADSIPESSPIIIYRRVPSSANTQPALSPFVYSPSDSSYPLPHPLRDPNVPDSRGIGYFPQYHPQQGPQLSPYFTREAEPRSSPTSPLDDYFIRTEAAPVPRAFHQQSS